MADQEFHFTIAIDGATELTPELEKALLESGCDDATFGVQNGRLWGDFSRAAVGGEEAIPSAIRDIHPAAAIVGMSLSPRIEREATDLHGGPPNSPAGAHGTLPSGGLVEID